MTFQLLLSLWQPKEIKLYFRSMAVEKCNSGSKERRTTRKLKNRITMSIQELINSGANVSITVNALDLRDFVLSLISERDEEKRKSIPAPETYLTQDEVSEKLRVDKSTLWRWDKIGYLNKCRVGGKVRYRQSEVEKLMTGGR